MHVYIASRMPMHEGRCSLAVKKTDTLCFLASPQTLRANTGSLELPLRPQTGSFCLHVKLKRTRRTGSLRFRLLLTGRCSLRSMQVNWPHGSFIHPLWFLSMIHDLHCLCSGGLFQAQAMTVLVFGDLLVQSEERDEEKERMKFCTWAFYKTNEQNNKDLKVREFLIHVFCNLEKTKRQSSSFEYRRYVWDLFVGIRMSKYVFLCSQW